MEAHEHDDLALVMGMPRRELFTVRGFVTAINLEVLSSLEEESWFATPTILADDVEAKEVQVGVVFTRDSQVLLNEEGMIIHVACVPAEAMDLGPALRSLRDLARMGAEQMMDTNARSVTLRGYFNDDQTESTRPYFIMVYEVVFPSESSAPQGYSWVDRRHLRDVALEPISIQVAEGFYPSSGSVSNGD